MTAGQSSNEMMRGKGEFFHLEDRASDHLFIEKVWRCYTETGGYVSLGCGQQF